MRKQCGFTLLELIIVIIIIGVLATLGFSQYSLVVEKGRTAEAKAVIGSMRKLATEYWFKYGDMTNIQNSDCAVNGEYVPDSSHYYTYYVSHPDSTSVCLVALRWAGGGSKQPDPQFQYWLYEIYSPRTGSDDWYCEKLPGGSYQPCFGYPAGPWSYP